MRTIPGTLLLLVGSLACGPESTHGLPPANLSPQVSEVADGNAPAEVQAAPLAAFSLPFASASVRQQRLQALQARLGPAWKMQWYSAEQLHPSGALGQQPVHRGSKSAGEVEAIATAFLAAQGDLFGLSARDLSAMGYSLEWVDNRFWRYNGNGVRSTPGYESFAGLARRLSVSVEVWSDGTVLGIQVSGQELPPLQLDATPSLGDVDPKVRNQVIGHEVMAIENPPGAYVTGPTRLIGRGPVMASDIKDVRLDILMKQDSAKQATNLVLVYVFEVRKFEDNPFTFWVDAHSGALVAARDQAVYFVGP